MPDGLRWDLYLGRHAEDIPYHPIYHPFNWRGWTDFGVGALGDMGAHLIDHPYWALGLDASDEHRGDVDAVGHDADSAIRAQPGGPASRSKPVVLSAGDARALPVRARAASSRR